MAVFSIASMLVGTRRAGRLGLVGVAGLELVWTVLGEAIVGFAIAWQSG